MDALIFPNLPVMNVCLRRLKDQFGRPCFKETSGYDLRRGDGDFRTVGKAGVPISPALRSEVHEVPDRSEQIDATLLNVGSHPRMRCVEVAQDTIGTERENGNS